MESRREIAVGRFTEAMDLLVRDVSTLPQALRLCLDASILADLADDAEWFRNQLEGYSTTSDLPSYRRNIRGSMRIVPQNPAAATPGSPIRYLNDLGKVTHPSVDDPPRPTVGDFPQGVEWLLEAATRGFLEAVSDWETLTSPSGLSTQWRWQASFPAEAIEEVVRVIHLDALRKAREAMIALTYGDAVEDIWNEYRRAIEAALPKMGLADNLAAIRDNIQSRNPERWRDAMYACRSALVTLAGNLWKDRAKTYAPIHLDGRAMKLDSTAYINR